jgi:hypothetical protein
VVAVAKLQKPSAGRTFGLRWRCLHYSGERYIPKKLADDLWLWKQESPNSSPEAFIFANAKGGFMDSGDSRNRVMRRLAEELKLPKLTFQVSRRRIATLAQTKGGVKDVQGMLCHRRTPPRDSRGSGGRNRSREPGTEAAGGWSRLAELPQIWYDLGRLIGPFRKVVKSKTWACGAAGSALPWHGRGRRFDPDQVHQHSPQYLRGFSDISHRKELT